MLRSLEIDGYFEAVIVSAEVGTEKPDPRIFEILLKEAQLDANRALYVGDNYYDDVIGSRKVGMESVLINRFGREGVEEIADCTIIPSIAELPDMLLGIESGNRRL